MTQRSTISSECLTIIPSPPPSFLPPLRKKTRTNMKHLRLCIYDFNEIWIWKKKHFCLPSYEDNLNLSVPDQFIWILKECWVVSFTDTIDISSLISYVEKMKYSSSCLLNLWSRTSHRRVYIYAFTPLNYYSYVRFFPFSLMISFSLVTIMGIRLVKLSFILSTLRFPPQYLVEIFSF